MFPAAVVPPLLSYANNTNFFVLHTLHNPRKLLSEVPCCALPKLNEVLCVDCNLPQNTMLKEHKELYLLRVQKTHRGVWI